MKHLDEALEELPEDIAGDYEEEIELWITYGGD
jgi:hypothetical protein